jgi:DNA polymerase I-like protein with 3'-5' exonuclease and polymerase domains
MMLRGVLVSGEAKKRLGKEILDFTVQLLKEVTYIVGWDLTGDKGGFSSQKLQDLFYERLKLPVQKKKGMRNGKPAMVPTCEDEALKTLAKKEPLIAPLIQRINMIRSYATAWAVCKAATDMDGRWRTSYNVAGTDTYRLSSSENPFGSGLNLQNLTLGRDIL